MINPFDPSSNGVSQPNELPDPFDPSSNGVSQPNELPDPFDPSSNGVSQHEFPDLVDLVLLGHGGLEICAEVV
jgi:hypothetical protein